VECLHFGRETFRIRYMPISFWRLLPAFVLLTAVALPSGAVATQAQASGTALKIGLIRVSGQKKFSAEQVVAATGLKTGQNFNPEDLDAVAERLGKSGAFPTISYSYVPEGGSVSIEFKVQEAPKFRSVCLTISFG
jgi:outer membrane protein assembly factor BamA